MVRQAIQQVDGILLPRPFKIVKHGPVNIFVEDVEVARDWYTQIMGFVVTEEVTYRGQWCAFLRCSTEHHSLGLLAIGLSPNSTCASFGIQVANYRQLREAVSFLRNNDVSVETDLMPPELHAQRRNDARWTRPTRPTRWSHWTTPSPASHFSVPGANRSVWRRQSVRFSERSLERKGASRVPGSGKRLFAKPCAGAPKVLFNTLAR